MLLSCVLLGVRGPLARILGCGPMQPLGDAAFAIYVLQEPLYMWANLVAGEELSLSAGFIVAWAAGTILVALVVARLVERPARRALRGIMGIPAAAPATTDPRGAGPAALRGARPLRP